MGLPSSSRGGQRVRLVVLHTAEGARTNASLYNYFNSTQVASCHAGIDDSGVSDGWVDYARASWTLRNGNAYSDNAEICGFAKWSRAEWLAHPGMLKGAAEWVRSRCNARGIPIVKLPPADVRAGKAGVCGHVDYTNATGDGTHWDPGPNFPWDIVIDLARGTGGGGSNPGGPAAPTVEDDIMSLGNGGPTPAGEWGRIVVPLNGRRYLRIATSYGDAVKIDGISIIDDTPAGSGANGKTVQLGGSVAPDRPGPWDLAKTDVNFANYSHVVIRYQCAGPVTAWVNDRT